MKLTQLINDPRFTESQIANTLQSVIQALLDANYPGLKADKLGTDMILEFTTYIAENYTFSVSATDSMNHIIAQPKL